MRQLTFNELDTVTGAMGSNGYDSNSTQTGDNVVQLLAAAALLAGLLLTAPATAAGGAAFGLYLLAAGSGAEFGTQAYYFICP